MKRFFKIFIITLAVIGLLAATITALLFVPSFQQLLKREAVESLSDKLQTEVNLDSVSFSIVTGDVSLIGLDVKDQKGEPMLHANVLKGKMYFWKFLGTHKQRGRSKRNTFPIEYRQDSNPIYFVRLTSWILLTLLVN